MKARKLLRFAAWFVAIAALASTVAFVWWRASGRPQREGEAPLAGLGANVEVRFDEAGVPHVRAASAADAARALGWLHANDRMGQMELLRRYAQGRLAEIVGPAAARSDRSVRELRFPQTVEALEAALGDESRALLAAYAQGVNAWLEQRGGDLPPDVLLLRVRPAPWTPRDSLCVQLRMSQMLSYSVGREFTRTRWLHELGERPAQILIGARLDDVPSATLEELARRWGAASAAQQAQAAKTTSNGSNNWAVAGARSTDGHALVANDPHLSLGLPALWFQAQIRAPDYEAAGFTIPGLPVVVIGQGPRLAWGFTNTELDVCDAFLETLSDDGLSVRRDGAWSAVRVQRERVVVRGEADLEFDALSTEIGPLLSTANGLRYSLAWTGHQAFDPLRTFLGLARASDVDAVPALARDFIGPPQNLVCGDASGAIAYVLLGRNVERGAGSGRVPLLAENSAQHWRGLRPYEHAPSSIRPSDGQLVTANNDLRPALAEYPFPQDAASEHRARRIAERLAERERWDAPTLGALQNDSVSLYAAELVAALLELASVPGPPLTDEAERALAGLRAWDGDMSQRGPSALYFLFEAQLDAWIGESTRAAFSFPERDRVRLEAVLGRLDEPFLTSREDSAQALGLRRAKVLEALARAWREGVQLFGADLAQWNYGARHVWRPEHPLASIPLLGRAFGAGEHRVPGSGTSPCVFSGPRQRAEDGAPRVAVEHGASLRWVANCGAPDASLAILPGGQSGHPFDPHYADQVQAYLAGELRAVRWSEPAIEAATRSRLRLVPR